MLVKEIMTKDICAVNPNTNLTSVAQTMKTNNIGFICVCDSNNNLVGVITDRDIVLNCVAAGLDPANCLVSNCMTSGPVSVSPNASLEDCANVMAAEQIRRLPVVDNGKVIGVISLGDLAVNLQNDSLLANTLRSICTPIRGSMPGTLAA